MAISDQLERLSHTLDKLIGNEPTRINLTIEDRLRCICDQLENIETKDSLTIGKTTITENDLKKILELI